MSDFDFDEIDKAVAGVLTPEESAAKNDTAPIQPVSAVSAVSTPVAAQPAPTPEVATSQRTPLAPAARRSSGRFMDVVHPSSDMRTRTGYTPVSETQPVEPRTTAFVPPAVEEKQDDDWTKPLDSPFLPDAKVEKRPLGGSVATQDFNPQDLLNAPDEELLLEEPNDPRLEATVLPDPIDFAAQFAEEAKASDSEPIVEERSPEPAVEAPQQPDAEPELEVEKDATPEAETQPTTAHEPIQPEEPVGPTSISQQYQERPVEAKASGAIYDTENYHQPMAVAPKKHAGAWGILWIVLLVILGAGAGVAFYLFILPML